MRPILEVADQVLVWQQPARSKRAFELRAGDEVVATLRFARGSLAEAEAANHRWTFKREGFWHPRVTVRVEGSDTDVAVFKPSWSGGGTLERPQEPVKLIAANMWHSQWVWQVTKDVPLVHFKSHQGFFKTSAEVEVSRGAVDPADVPLLVLLGWYLILLFAEDAAAASIATITTVSSG